MSDAIAFYIKNYKYADGTYLLVWCANLPTDDIGWSIYPIWKNAQENTEIITQDDHGKIFKTFVDVRQYCDSKYGTDAIKITGWRGYTIDFREIYCEFPEETTWRESTRT